jgi:hypothetical protein
VTTREPSAPAEPLRDFEAAAEFLGISESWLRPQVAARAVPHTRLGRRVLFSADQLVQIVAANAVEPGPSPAAVVMRHQRRVRKPA